VKIWYGGNVQTADTCLTPECGFEGYDPKIAGKRNEESRL